MFHRYKALDAGVDLLPFIIDTLESMKGSTEFRTDWDKCASLLNSLTSFQFIYVLYVTREVMSATKELSKKLQGSLLFK